MAATDKRPALHHHGAKQCGNVEESELTLRYEAKSLIDDDSTCSLVRLQNGRKVVTSSISAWSRGKACAGTVEALASTIEGVCAP